MTCFAAGIDLDGRLDGRLQRAIDHALDCVELKTALGRERVISGVIAPQMTDGSAATRSSAISLVVGAGAPGLVLFAALLS